MPAPTERADVVVVGAGFAGLTAARRLRDAGKRVVLLEARDRVGGRSLNHVCADGSTVDIGAQWVGPGQERLYALAREMGVAWYPTSTAGAFVLEVDGTTYRDIFTLPPEVLTDFLGAQQRLDEMALEVDVERPWASARAAEWDGQTVETWLTSEYGAGTAAARGALRVAFRAVFAAEPACLSLLFALFYIRAAGGFDPLTGMEGGAQQDIFLGGSQEIAVRLAAKLGDVVRLGQPVRRIAQDANGVRVVADGCVVEAAHVVVALPPTLAGRLVYEPPMPAARDQLTQRMPHGSVIKLQLVYPKPFWRDDGLSGNSASDAGPVDATMDGSRPNAERGILVAFLEGDHARALGAIDPVARRAAVLQHLERLFGPQAAHPIELVERDWSAEEYTRGCYGAHLPPGVWTRYGPVLREPVGRIHWAGTDSATVWAGYMDGAIESGERAADAVLAGLVTGSA
ncbi:MAG: flavin monoamine oxidase family protein [bacterium]|nr:flavin monoamine oxidase family protein [bacterium]